MGARPSPPTTPSSHTHTPDCPPRLSPLHAAPPSLAAARARLRRALLPPPGARALSRSCSGPCISPRTRGRAQSRRPLHSALLSPSALGLPGGWGEGAPRCAWPLSPSWILSQRLANGTYYPPALQPFSARRAIFSGERKGDLPEGGIERLLGRKRQTLRTGWKCASFGICCFFPSSSSVSAQ